MSLRISRCPDSERPGWRLSCMVLRFHDMLRELSLPSRLASHGKRSMGNQSPNPAEPEPNAECRIRSAEFWGPSGQAFDHMRSTGTPSKDLAAGVHQLLRRAWVRRHSASRWAVSRQAYGRRPSDSTSSPCNNADDHPAARPEGAEPTSALVHPRLRQRCIPAPLLRIYGTS